jgi:Leucine-rich repeat (LRR) protein
MPDTPPQPAPTKKLGGIPEGEQTEPGVYRKPPTFKMQPIPRPVEKTGSRRSGGRPGRRKGPLITGIVLLLLLGGGYFGWKKAPQIVALLRRPEPTPRPFVTGPAPEDTSPLADPAAGFSWLFTEEEWRATSGKTGEFKGGLVHLRESMAKPQPETDGVIRARIRVREGGSAAGVMMRSTEENGRYRLFIDPDLRHVRLVLQKGDEITELGKYRFFRSILRGDLLTLELRVEGKYLFGSVNGAVVIEAEDGRLREPGSWGIEGGDAWFELVEVPTPKPKPMVAETTAPAEPAMPAMPAATPVPAPPAPVTSDTFKWLAGLEPQWKADFARDVTDPFDKGVADLKKQLLGTIESQLATATQAKKLDDAAFLRGEKQRLEKGEDVPMVDEAIVPQNIRTLRNGYRGNFTRLDQERSNRAKTFFTRIDTQLAQSQTALIQRQRAPEAAEVKAKREELAALWIKPLAGAPPPTVAANAAATPAAARPALGTTTSATAKLPPRQVVEKLLALGAGVWVIQTDKTNQPNQRGTEVTSMTELSGDKFTITHVDFKRLKPDEKPVTADDYVIVEHLSDVNELTLRGPGVTELIMAKLQGFRNLSRLSLEGLSGLKAPGYAVLPTLSNLRELDLRGMSPSDDAMKIVSQCRKIQRLTLANLPIGDEVFVSIAKLPALEEITLNNLDKITSPAIAHLGECHSLKRINFGGIRITSPMIEAVSKSTGLESLSLNGNPLKDTDIASLTALSRIQSLGLRGTEVVGTVFTKWPARPSVQSLDLQGAAGVNDEALKGIASAFPKLTTLEFKVVPLGATAAGFSSLGRLRSLRTLRITGEGVNDEIAAELAKCDDLQSLSLGGARLTDPGAAALAKLSKVTDLNIDHPPVTDPALKAFAKMKALKSLTIAADAPPETEQKLRASLPGVSIRK